MLEVIIQKKLSQINETAFYFSSFINKNFTSSYSAFAALLLVP